MVPRSKVYSFVPFAERQSGAELFCYPLNKKKTEKERISMQAMIDELAKQAKESLGQVSSKETLATFWQEYLSKNGKIPALMKNLRSVAPEERPAMGKIINELKTKVQADYDAAAAKVKEAELAARNAAETVDITLPAKTRAVGGLHPLTLVTNQIIDVFSGMGFAVADAPEIEDDDHNFTRLNVPKDHPARDMQDTFYLSDEFLLRTQTSGGQIRTMDSQKPPIKVLIPGRVFRSDSDATHSPMFHQMEGLVVDKGMRVYCTQNLFGHRFVESIQAQRLCNVRFVITAHVAIFLAFTFFKVFISIFVFVLNFFLFLLFVLFLFLVTPGDSGTALPSIASCTAPPRAAVSAPSSTCMTGMGSGCTPPAAARWSR